MKRSLFLTAFLLLLASCGFGQMILVDHGRWQVEGNLKRYFKNKKVIVSQTDTSLTYLLRDSTSRPLDIYCSFTKRNCTFQKIGFDCDSCYHKFLKYVLEYKNLEWNLVGMNRYLSKYGEHLLLVGDDKHLYYTITLVNYSKEEYQRLTAAK